MEYKIPHKFIPELKKKRSAYVTYIIHFYKHLVEGVLKYVDDIG